jgi:guanylate kinase
LPDLVISVSVTTRTPRSFERDGVDYRFVSDDEFDRMVAAGELLEWAEIFGHRSGTPAGPVRSRMAEGRDVLLELDVQGARQVREAVPEAVLMLLEPPSIQELERRLRARGTETEDLLARRLSKAEWELGQRDLFDQVVVNDDAEAAAGEVAAIIGASPRQPTEGSADP